MDVKEYLEIAEGNETVGKWAKENSYYNASISRYYYVLYQKLLCVIFKKDIDFKTGYSEGIHKDNIKMVMKYYRAQKQFRIAGHIDQMTTLRRIRNDADYEKKINETEMNSFFTMYNNINRELNNIIR